MGSRKVLLTGWFSARACRWPAVLPAEGLAAPELDRWWAWCLAEGRVLARLRQREWTTAPSQDRTDDLVMTLAATARTGPAQRRSA